MVPVMVNTTIRRISGREALYAFGRRCAQRRVMGTRDKRLALIASCGLSAHVVPERDRRDVIEGADEQKAEVLFQLPRPKKLRGGTSEIPIGSTLAGAMEDREGEIF